MPRRRWYRRHARQPDRCRTHRLRRRLARRVAHSGLERRAAGGRSGKGRRRPAPRRGEGRRCRDRRPPAGAGEECRRCGEGSSDRGSGHDAREGRGCRRRCADRSEARRRESPVVGPGVDHRIADPPPARDSACDRAAPHVGGRPPWRARDSRVGSRARPLLAVQFRADSVTCRLGRPARCGVGFDRLVSSRNLLGERDVVTRRAAVVGVLACTIVGLRRADLWVGHGGSSHRMLRTYPRSRPRVETLPADFT